jgi:hypothetical protein
MRFDQINDLLRSLSIKIIRMGFNKTTLGKILFGSSCMANFVKFLNNETEFGIKPLTKTSEIVDYELHMVFINPKKDNKELIDRMYESNRQFTIELEEYLTQTMSKKITTKERKENIINNMVDDIIFNDKK